MIRRALLLLAALVAFTLASAPAQALSRFGVCSTTCTWDGASTAMWAATTGGATGASVPTSSDTVTFDANTCVGGTTCTITVNTTVNVISITMNACTASTTGCIVDFSVNNNNVTLQTFSNSGTGTRNLKMGNGTWTITSSTAGAAVWTQATTTNLTFNSNGSTIVLSGNPAAGTAPITFSGGAQTYNAISLSAQSNRSGVVISGANTFGTFSVAAPQSVQFPNGSTTTITNAFTWTGGSTSNPISIMSQGSNSTATISVASGTPTMDGAELRAMTFTGGATFTATNSIDQGLNNGITISAPSGTSGGKIIGG